MKKSFVLILTALFFCLLHISWSFKTTPRSIIEDYFISKYSTVKFLLSTTQVHNGDMYRYMYYLKTPDGYKITDKYFTNKLVTSQTMRSIIIKNDEVQLTEESNTSPGKVDVSKKYNPPITLLKMPAMGKTTSWRYTLDSTAGNTFFCTANFIDNPVIINDKPQVFHDILIMRSSPAMNGKLLMEYYEKGSGLIKVESANSDGSDKIVLYERVNL